jgi:hypothetical protein
MTTPNPPAVWVKAVLQTQIIDGLYHYKDKIGKNRQGVPSSGILKTALGLPKTLPVSGLFRQFPNPEDLQAHLLPAQYKNLTFDQLRDMHKQAYFGYDFKLVTVKTASDAMKRSNAKNGKGAIFEKDSITNETHLKVGNTLIGTRKPSGSGGGGGTPPVPPAGGGGGGGGGGTPPVPPAGGGGGGGGGGAAAAAAAPPAMTVDQALATMVASNTTRDGKDADQLRLILEGDLDSDIQNRTRRDILDAEDTDVQRVAYDNLLPGDSKFFYFGGIRPGDRYLSQPPDLDSKYQNNALLAQYTVGASTGYTAQGPRTVTGLGLFGAAPQTGTYIPPQDGVGNPSALTPEESAAVGITGLPPDYGPGYQPYVPKKRRKFSARIEGQLAPIMQQMLGTGYTQNSVTTSIKDTYLPIFSTRHYT